MSKFNFDENEKETLKVACDIFLRNNGISRLKELSSLIDKIDQKDIEYSSLDIRLIQQLCDVALKTSGVLVLTNVVVILRKLAMSEIKA